MGILDQIFDSNKKELKRMQKKVDQILALDSRFAAMSDDELKGQTLILKERLAQGETLDDLLVDAFATVRETGARVLGMKHFPVQLLGGMALHEGTVASMQFFNDFEEFACDLDIEGYIMLIIDVAVAFCDWLSQCPVFISHYRQMTTTAYAQAVLAPGFNPQIAIVLLPDQTMRVMLHKWHGGASHILRVKIKKVIG